MQRVLRDSGVAPLIVLTLVAGLPARSMRANCGFGTQGAHHER